MISMKKLAPLFVILGASLWGVDGIVLRPSLFTLPVPLVVFIESAIPFLNPNDSTYAIIRPPSIPVATLIIPSIICGCVSGTIIGLVNYYMVFKIHLPAFLATIGTMFIAKGIGMYISKGWEIYPLPESLGMFGSAQPLNISWHFWIFIFLIVISQLLLSFTLWGLEVKATGSDREIARLTEVNIEKASMSTFLICGTLSAFAGMLLMSRLGAGKPAIGVGWELQVITAVAIGGVSLFGYEGSFLGVFLGILAIQVIQNGLIIIGLSPYLNTIVVGMILLFTAFVDWKRRASLDILKEQAG